VDFHAAGVNTYYLIFVTAPEDGGSLCFPTSTYMFVVRGSAIWSVTDASGELFQYHPRDDAIRLERWSEGISDLSTRRQGSEPSS